VSQITGTVKGGSLMTSRSYFSTNLDEPVPVHLPEPVPDPDPEPGCDVCGALAEQRRTAKRDGNLTRVTDINIELRNHGTRHDRKPS
jgi:hypothetical protein